jgi:hypothetical protein
MVSWTSALLVVWLTSLASSAYATPVPSGIVQRCPRLARVEPRGLVDDAPCAWRVLRPYDLIYQTTGTAVDWGERRLAALADAKAAAVQPSWGSLVAPAARRNLTVVMPGPLMLADVRWTWTWINASRPVFDPSSGLLLEPDEDVATTWGLLAWRVNNWLLVGGWELDIGRAASQPRQTLTVAMQWEVPSEASWPTFAIFSILGIHLAAPYSFGTPFIALGMTLEIGAGADGLFPPWVPGPAPHPWQQ